MSFRRVTSTLKEAQLKVAASCKAHRIWSVCVTLRVIAYLRDTDKHIRAHTQTYFCLQACLHSATVRNCPKIYPFDFRKHLYENLPNLCQQTATATSADQHLPPKSKKYSCSYFHAVLPYFYTPAACVAWPSKYTV